MKKVLITGRTGYIARALVNTFESNHWITTSTSRCGNDSSLALDLCNSEAFDYSVLGPKDIVIHLAGVSSPDICRRDQARSLKINVEGTLTFLHRCIERGARVIFYSSDVVYGMTSNGVDEQAETQPVGLYGQMKRDVEIELVKSQKAKIVRLSYVFSRNDKFLQYLAESDARNEAATIFHPFFRNVVHLLDVIEGTRSLCENWEQFPQNIFNFGGPELISRLDIA